jgi:hypothetical protein
LQIATVGLSTSSITRLNGSVIPLEQLLALLDQRVELGKEIGHCRAQSSRTAFASCPTVSISAARFIVMMMSNSSSTGDEVHHGQAVPLQVLLEAGLGRHLHALLVEGFDLRLHALVNFVAVIHLPSPIRETRFRNAMGRECGAKR